MLGLAAVGGKVYAIGGWDGGLGTGLGRGLRPAARRLGSGGEHEREAHGHASVVLDGKIYAMGGYGWVGALDTVEVYDPQADSWQRVASMPQGRYRSRRRSDGWQDLRDWWGDNQGTSSVNSVCVYDPQANAWTQLAAWAQLGGCHASAAVGGKLYCLRRVGDEGESLNTVEVYDPASDSWAQGPSLTSARDLFVAVAL